MATVKEVAAMARRVFLPLYFSSIFCGRGLHKIKHLKRVMTYRLSV